jgi:cystathionine gamma-lyase
MKSDNLDARIARMLHAGSTRQDVGAPLQPAITMTSAYRLLGDPAAAAHQYGRFSNPTWEALEDALTILEDAPVAIFPSGMAAITAVLMATLKAGDRVLMPADGYYTVRALVEEFLGPMGVEIATCPTREMAEADATGCKLVWLETPSNPGLDVCDIGLVAAKAKAAGALIVVDNTTASPLGQRPLELGADAVVVADTKSIAGHSDVLAGHVATRDDALMARVLRWRRLSGSIASPFDAWAVLRGLDTFHLRFPAMCANALTIAARLQERGLSVRHPGLAGDPAHAVAARTMRLFGHMLILTLPDGASADRFLASAQLIRPATSFGGVHSSAERRDRWGDAVPPGFIRISIGCEPVEALWADITAALDAAVTS